MVMPIPPWIIFIVMGAIGIDILVFLGLFLPWAWRKFFNYLGRNETRQIEGARDA